MLQRIYLAVMLSHTNVGTFEFPFDYQCYVFHLIHAQGLAHQRRAKIRAGKQSQVVLRFSLLHILKKIEGVLLLNKLSVYSALIP